jgi:hypothetical protein
MHYARWRSTGDPLRSASGQERRRPPLRAPARCAIPDCDEVAKTRGWCQKHYYRWRTSGDPLKTRSGKARGVVRICTVEACEEPRSSRGLCRKHRSVVSLYGVTTEWYDAALLRGCAICGRVDAPRFAVDHDHSCCPGTRACGKCTRGVLCNLCNVGLGSFGDDPERLQAAIDYLSRS